MTESRRIDRLRGVAVSVLWGLNVTALVGVSAWMLLDARFSQVLHAQLSELSASDGAELAPVRDWSALGWRLPALRVAVVCAAVSLAGVFLGLFVGASRHRQIRAWLACMSLVAGWLTLAMKRQDLHWAGQWLRARSNVARFEHVAASLRDAWPTEDGEHCQLGPFMAYPQEQPVTLILLSSPSVPDGSLTFSTVERSETGGLRFHLDGADRDVWLEWHPPGELPDSFVGGLQDGHELARFSRCGDQWFLAAYHSARHASP